MKLSAPISVLKSKAKGLKRTQSISMTQALDHVAQAEGFSSWSLLQSKAKDLLPKKKEEILGFLNPGDLVLIGSRPGSGKTTLTLEILAQAVKEKRKCYFFSLDFTANDVARLSSFGGAGIQFDFSDEISAEYILNQTKDSITKGGIIAVDYLQLLDQKRTKPELQSQVEALKKFAQEKKMIIIFISQIDRAFEEKGTERPNLSDVRLPNPVDLKLFNKVMFLHAGKISFRRPVEFDLS